ncbi:hypothetical protein ACIP79_00675 [Streptomyces sp. NPDC088747]
MSRTKIRWRLAALCDWGCVYPGCGAWFGTYAEMQQHLSGHYR